MGDRLIVSLTLDQHVNKGPERPIYKWAERAELLLELKCVDEVIPTANAVDAILAVKPSVFVKGTDYSAGDMWSEPVLKACMEVGAEIRFTKSRKLSATDAIVKVMRARV